MRQNLDKLWGAVYPGGRETPSIRPGTIKRRVHAALDAALPERKRTMRQHLRLAAVCAAVLAVLAGTALAAYRHYTALQYFQGDVALREQQHRGGPHLRGPDRRGRGGTEQP